MSCYVIMMQRYFSFSDNGLYSGKLIYSDGYFTYVNKSQQLLLSWIWNKLKRVQ